MCTPVYGRKFVKASQFTMCRRFFLFVSFYNAADLWLLFSSPFSFSLSLSLALSLVHWVCSTAGLWWLWCVFSPVPTGMVKHFPAHSFIDLLSMLYIFFLFSFSFFSRSLSSSFWCVSYLLSAWCTWSHSTSEYTMFVLAFTIHMHWLGGSSTSTTFYQHTNCPN